MRLFIYHKKFGQPKRGWTLRSRVVSSPKPQIFEAQFTNSQKPVCVGVFLRLGRFHQYLYVNLLSAHVELKFRKRPPRTPYSDLLSFIFYLLSFFFLVADRGFLIRSRYPPAWIIILIMNRPHVWDDHWQALLHCKDSHSTD